MLINCTSRKCGKNSEAKLNRTTGEILCAECGEPIQNVTEAMKRTLNSMGQVIRGENKQAFQVFCPTCKKNVFFLVEDGKCYCPACKEYLKVSPSFVKAYEDNLKNNKDE